jgi:pimeloyl-ACP methyl ester carboxylesterase
MNSQWIFLRGLARESRHWGTFPQEFEKQLPGSKVICLDLPGAGIHSNLNSPLSMAGVVRFLRDQLQSQRTDQPTFLFSISLGSMVAAEWLTLFPEDFSGAVLINTSFKGWSPFYKRLSPKAYLHLVRIILSRNALSREAEVLKMVSNRPELHPELAQEWSKIFTSRPMTLNNSLRQLALAAFYGPPRTIPQVPVLILNSLSDQMVDPSCSERVAKKWSAPLRRHPSAGHELLVDEPDWAIQSIASWLPTPISSA